MAQFVEVPIDRLDSATLDALLEEFASRDGTDYGHYELTLEGKVANLRGQLDQRTLRLLFDAASESWDLVSAEIARELLA